MTDRDAWIGPSCYALPRRTITNDEWATSHPEWDMARTTSKTGVTARHIADPDETSRTLGARAAGELLRAMAMRADELDGIVVCTQTPDHPLPPNSTLLHADLAMREDAPAFDINHACSGFIYAAILASGLLSPDESSSVLVVTGDTYSRLIAPDDRATRTVFGDGAAATLIRRSPTPPSTLRIADHAFGTNGGGHERFIVRGGGAGDPDGKRSIDMDGLGMLKFVLTAVPPTIDGVLERNGLTRADIDLFVFHQASNVAIESLSRSMGIPEERVILDMADTGNLVSASIPTCLARAEAAGRLDGAQRVVIAGFGVGLSWGVILAEAAP